MEKLNKGIYPYKINDYVMYKNNGICKITDIREENFNEKQIKTYYVMQVVYDERSLLYVPVESANLEANMRHILSAAEIISIISASEESLNQWIEDSKARAVRFEQILSSGDRAEILWLIKVLSLYKLEIEKQKNKRLNASEAKILLSAERVITEEFAFVLKLKKDEVIPFIVEQIKKIHIKEKE